MRRNPMNLLVLLFGVLAFMSSTASAQIVEACDGANDLNNIAEVTAAAELDVDSTPNNQSTNPNEDDTAQDCTTITSLIDLELSKVVSRNITLDGICSPNNDSGNKLDTAANCDGNTGNGDPNVVYCGDEIEYKLVLSNTGASTATGITVTDTLPAALVYIDSDGGDSDFYDDGTNEVSWTVNSLAKATSVDLFVTADVTCS